MSQPFIGEIRMFGGSFAPAGWAFCQGQLLPISENDTLFNLIGTTYGGDGQVSFALPDLQGRVVVHAGQGSGLSQNYQLAEKFGAEQVTLTTNSMPIHRHALQASPDPATAITPVNGVLAAPPTISPYFAAPTDTPLNAVSVLPVGGSQPHENMMPFLAISFIISLFGIYPTP